MDPDRSWMYNRNIPGRARYTVWTSHGEVESDSMFNNFVVGESSRSTEHNYFQGSRMSNMVDDAFGMHSDFEQGENVEEAPNEEANIFYEQLRDCSSPLFNGSQHSKLSVAVSQNREEERRKREEEIAAAKEVENKRYASLQAQLTFLFESGNILPPCPASSDGFDQEGDENDKSDKESEGGENGKSDKESEGDEE
ncbi:hypothetical protein H5410_045466 [Solanum commersonii]|uniref:Uncharacterized protein n=1 Tax=Solanum commersonii TaxID=4109 RepID=A0A9J5XDQ9_SOLCO|nr:hypothetical protein H5410_045466 [Solanum commersonii]